MSGKNNEDRYLVSAFRLPDAGGLPAVLCVIADGIGGHRAGEVAAEIAVETISRVVAAGDASQPLKTLQDAVQSASQLILAEAENDPALQGMGATCACGWVIGSRLYVVTVGDSRVYLVRDKSIRQLSIDHTWIQEALDRGVLTPEQTVGHPNAHVIRRYLGSRSPVVPDLRLRLDPRESDKQSQANQGLKLLPGDQLLLCSDGLTDLVEDQEILHLLQTNGQEEALNKLVDLANQRGGRDNITVISMQVPRAQPAAAIPAPKKKRWLPFGAACAGATALLVAGAILLGLLYLYYNLPVPVLFPTNAAPNTATASAPAATQTPQPSPTPTPTAVQLDAVPPGILPQASPGTSPLPATLTPWPTNTPAPNP